MRHPILLTASEAHDWCSLRNNSVLAGIAVACESGGAGVFLQALVKELTLAHLVITDV